MLEAKNTTSEWHAFVKTLELAEEEFIQGKPAAFKQLWSRTHDVTLCGGFGGIERGWKNVTDRLDWVSTKYSDGSRTRQEVSCTVTADFAYLVQTETIRCRVPGHSEISTQALRATMVFRRESEGWRILHRHADMQTATRAP